MERIEIVTFQRKIFEELKNPSYPSTKKDALRATLSKLNDLLTFYH